MTYSRLWTLWDIQQAAEQAEREGDVQKAEALYLRATTIEECYPGQRASVEAKYIVFLVGQQQCAKAAALLEHHLRAHPEHRDSGGVALRTLLAQADEATALDCLCTIAPQEVLHPWDLLQLSEDRARAGQLTLGRAIAEAVQGRSRCVGDDLNRWRAEGQIGRVLERAGRLDEAIAVWQKAFDEGSPNRVIADRLSLHLERTRDYKRCIAVVEVVLTRISPDAELEEKLRKRSARCLARLNGANVRHASGSALAFTVRAGENNVRLEFQVRPKGTPRKLQLGRDGLTYLACATGRVAVATVDTRTGVVQREREALASACSSLLTEAGDALLWDPSAGWYLGETPMWFVSSSASGTGERHAGGIIQVVHCGARWFVASTTEGLTAYEANGELSWTFSMGGRPGFAPDLFASGWVGLKLAATDELVLIAAQSHLYALDPQGNLCWQVQIPLPDASVATGGFHQGSSLLGTDWSHAPAFAILGLSRDASAEEIRTTFRKRAKETHPDHNPGDPDAAQKFREVYAAYETLARDATSPSGSAIDRTMSAADPAAMLGYKGRDEDDVTALGAYGRGFLVCTRSGAVFRTDATGRVTPFTAFELEDPWMQTDAQGRVTTVAGVAGADRSPVVLLPKGDSFVRISLAIADAAVRASPDYLCLFRGREVAIYDYRGRVLWSAEFARPVEDVVWTSHSSFACAAGVVAHFGVVPFRTTASLPDPESVVDAPPPEAIPIQVGKRVAHTKYGSGSVVQLKGDTAQVDFDAHGHRAIKISFLSCE